MPHRESASPWSAGPVPSFEDGRVLLRSNHRLVYHAAFPALVFAVIISLVGLTATTASGRGFALTATLLTVVAAAARVRSWQRGRATRVLVSSPTHLAVFQRGTPHRWIAWDEIDSVTVRLSAELPELSRYGGWFEVIIEPAIRIEPPQALVWGGLGEMLISGRQSEPAAKKVALEAITHGLKVTYSLRAR